MAQLWAEFQHYQSTFNGDDALEFTTNHSEIPVLVVSLYLFFVFTVPHFLKEPMKLKAANAAWDLSLTIFSICGAIATVPVLLHTLVTKGYVYTVCANPADWYKDGAPGLWVALFIYSKFPELLDTVFLVLQKKKVIFLHWFHHITVLLYCWHAHHYRVAPGLWFASMNYSVHSVMYLYYFCTAIGLRKVVRPIAPLITTLQLLQMVGGVVVTVSAAQLYFQDNTQCFTTASNLRLGLSMYASYFVLFAILFHNLYLKPTAKVIQTGCPDVAASLSVSDGSGFFHDNTNSATEKKLKKKQ